MHRHFTHELEEGLSFSRLQVRPPFVFAGTNLGEVRIYKIEGDRLRERGRVPPFTRPGTARSSLLMDLTQDGHFLHVGWSAGDSDQSEHRSRLCHYPGQ